MKVVNENNEITANRTATTDIDAIQMIAEAYTKGEIKITRQFTYRSKTPKSGHIFYRIKFVTVSMGERQSIYDGAYEMTLIGETKLTNSKRLTEFLLDQLRKALQTF